MSLNPGRPVRRHRFSLLLLSFLFLTVSCAQANAQGSVGSTRGLPGPSDGMHIIRGRVYFPSESKAGKRARVTLASPDSVSQSTTTDEDGAFLFNRLTAGNYTVSIDAGKEFEPAFESVYIGREMGTGPRNINLAINLRPKGAADPLAAVPPAARQLYGKGTEAAAKGDAKKAVEHLTAALSLYPEFPQALSELGVQYLKLGQPEKAAESLQASLKISPADIGARLSYGVALLNQKKFDEAEVQLREVLKKNDALPTAHMYLGVTLMSLKRLDDAEGELKRAVASNSAEVAAAHRYLGGIYWGKRDYKRAADELELYLKLVPKAPDAERTRAAIKELRGKQQ